LLVVHTDGLGYVNMKVRYNTDGLTHAINVNNDMYMTVGNQHQQIHSSIHANYYNNTDNQE
jgi:hypothetical protein